MTANELREKYIAFFKTKNHQEISGKSLLPDNDPTVLFTTAGMQPLVPYLLGEMHPQGNRLVNYQKCVRTGDIEEVGNASHLTCFEMLGNWSLGDYFKKDSIAYSYEFLTSKDWLALDPRKLSVTVFAGDENAPRDEESAQYWIANGMSEDKIAYLGAEDNWWAAGPTGPCGPDTEIFYWVGEGFPEKNSNKGTEPKLWLEIWNNVFMEYNRIDENTLVKLPKQNVDTGMGLERTTTILQGKTSVYETEIFKPIIYAIVDEVKKAQNNKSFEYGQNEENDRSIRIITDHIRSSVFILGDTKGPSPSNLGAGYVLRRLIRRAVRHAKKLGIEKPILSNLAKTVISSFELAFPELRENEKKILTELEQEEKKFGDTLRKGEIEFEKMLPNLMKGNAKIISGRLAFRLYDTFGFPIELTEELAREHGFSVNLEEFETAFKKHQEASKAGSDQLFKGGLAESSEITKRYHTATHLLQKALIQVLGDHVAQKGSNITAERMRFDFTHHQPMSADEIKKVEAIVNEQIEKALPVCMEVMSIEDAKKSGAIALFGEKYEDKVKVYSIGDYSKELCGGPHVENTSEIGLFRIQKEQSSSAGVRRIRAIIEAK